MSFFFKACFEAQVDHEPQYQKELDPRVSLLPN